MTAVKTVSSPTAQIITDTPIRVGSVFRLLAWLGSRQLRASTLSLRLRRSSR